MRTIIDYVDVVIVKRRKRTIVKRPIYEDIGHGAGLEKPKDKRSIFFATGDGNCIIRL